MCLFGSCWKLYLNKCLSVTWINYVKFWILFRLDFVSKTTRIKNKLSSYYNLPDQWSYKANTRCPSWIFLPGAKSASRLLVFDMKCSPQLLKLVKYYSLSLKNVEFLKLQVCILIVLINTQIKKKCCFFNLKFVKKYCHQLSELLKYRLALSKLVKT